MRAEEIWQKKLADYQAPEIDASILTGLTDYVAKRKSELD